MGTQAAPRPEPRSSYQQTLVVAKQVAAIAQEGEVVGELKSCVWGGLKGQESFRVSVL